jgi:hypothetical protein
LATGTLHFTAISWSYASIHGIVHVTDDAGEPIPDFHRYHHGILLARSNIKDERVIVVAREPFFEQHDDAHQLHHVAFPGFRPAPPAFLDLDRHLLAVVIDDIITFALDLQGARYEIDFLSLCRALPMMLVLVSPDSYVVVLDPEAEYLLGVPRVFTVREITYLRRFEVIVRETIVHIHTPNYI